MDWHTLALVYIGNLSSWHDPRLRALNPVLSSVPADELAPLNIVFGCSREGYIPLSFTVYAAFNEYIAPFEPDFAVHFTEDQQATDAFLACQSLLPTWFSSGMKAPSALS